MFKEKVIKGLICVLAIMLAAKCWAVAKEATQGTGTAEAIEPKLVMELKFDEPVVDVIWDEATMTVKEARALGVKGLGKRSAKEIVKVQYPKVVVLGKIMKDVTQAGYPYAEGFEELLPVSIKFFNEKGKKKREILLKEEIAPKGWIASVDFSKNKKYIGVTSNITQYSQEGLNEGSSQGKFTMVNDEGQILWETDISKLGRPLGVSPNGQYIVCTGDITGDFFDYMPSVWNSKGLVKKLFNKNYEELCILDFGKDGTWFAVSVATRALDVQTKNLTAAEDLVVFNEKGDELWRKNVGIRKDKWVTTELTISNDDVITVTSVNYETGKKIKYRFDKEGNLIESKQEGK